MKVAGKGAHRGFRFGAYTLDLTRGSLRAGDRPIELRPKSFGVLAYLVENAGRLVPKDELMAAVWSDVVVSDESLAKCVSEVRAALGDSDQRLVKTVPRRGYLLDAPVWPANGTPDADVLGSAAVSETPPAHGSGPSEVSRPARSGTYSGRQRVGLAAALLFVSLAVVALAVPWRRATGPPLIDLRSPCCPCRTGVIRKAIISATASPRT